MVAHVGFRGIDRLGAASLVIETAGAGGELLAAIAQIGDALRAAGRVDDSVGRLRAVHAWLDDHKRDIERRANLIDVADGTYGPYVPSMLLRAGPVPGNDDGRCNPNQGSWLGRRACSVSNHWRGPTQAAVVVSAAVAVSFCAAATAGVCAGAVGEAVVTGGIGGAAGVARYQISSGDHTLKGYVHNGVNGALIPQGSEGFGRYLAENPAGAHSAAMTMSDWLMFPFR